MNVRVPHWTGGLDITMRSTRRFKLTQVWDASIKQQTETQITFTTNHYPGGGADEQDNEFGFMGVTSSQDPYEEGDLVVVESEACLALRPRGPPPPALPPLPPRPPPPPPPLP